MKHNKSTTAEEFLLRFFENDLCAGWRNIAKTLLYSGTAIVVNSGSKQQLFGDMSDFIEEEPAKNAIDCTLYTFDFSKFTKSIKYKKAVTDYMQVLSDARRDAVYAEARFIKELSQYLSDKQNNRRSD